MPTLPHARDLPGACLHGGTERGKRGRESRAPPFSKGCEAIIRRLARAVKFFSPFGILLFARKGGGLDTLTPHAGRSAQ